MDYENLLVSWKHFHNLTLTRCKMTCLYQSLCQRYTMMHWRGKVQNRSHVQQQIQRQKSGETDNSSPEKSCFEYTTGKWTRKA